jgi:hypothetical protein
MATRLIRCPYGVAGPRAAPDVLLQSGHRQRPGGLGDRASVFEQILDGGADFVGAGDDDLVDAALRDLERLAPDLCHRHAIGEQVEALIGQGDAPAAASAAARHAEPSASTPTMRVAGDRYFT